MSLAIIESIAAQLLATVSAVSGFVARRVRRIDWASQVSGGPNVVTVLLVEGADGGGETLDDEQVGRAAIDVYLVVVDSDDATDPIDTRINLALAAACDALSADPDVGGYADTSGLDILGTTPIDDEEARIAGVCLHLGVTYSTDFADITAEGVPS